MSSSIELHQKINEFWYTTNQFIISVKQVPMSGLNYIRDKIYVYL